MLMVGCATKSNKPIFERGEQTNTEYKKIIIDSVQLGNKVSITKTDGEVIEIWVREITYEHISNNKENDQSMTRKILNVEIAEIESIIIIKESAYRSENVTYLLVFKDRIAYLFLFLVFAVLV